MALKLNLKKAVFPVEIGKFKYEVDLSDVKSQAFEDKLAAFLTESKELAEKNNNAGFGALLENIFNDLLGDGAYEQLYGYTQRVDLMVELLTELITKLVGNLPGRAKVVEKPDAHA